MTCHLSPFSYDTDLVSIHLILSLSDMGLATLAGSIDALKVRDFNTPYSVVSSSSNEPA